MSSLPAFASALRTAFGASFSAKRLIAPISGFGAFASLAISIPRPFAYRKFNAEGADIATISRRTGVSRVERRERKPVGGAQRRRNTGRKKGGSGDRTGSGRPAGSRVVQSSGSRLKPSWGLTWQRLVQFVQTTRRGR